MADITLVNLNMLFMRYGEEIERELHVPLGCLYLTRALESAGYEVDFRDYQLCPGDDPFDIDVDPKSCQSCWFTVEGTDNTDAEERPELPEALLRASSEALVAAGE